MAVSPDGDFGVGDGGEARTRVSPSLSADPEFHNSRDLNATEPDISKLISLPLPLNSAFSTHELLSINLFTYELYSRNILRPFLRKCICVR